MSHTPDYRNISVVEDLDPEPLPAGRFARTREALLGVGLLVAVLLWAGWQWWHQDNMQRSYRSAQQAAAERRWDDAFAGYRAASGYMNADVRATEVSKTITERDGHYSAARAMAEQRRWVEALSEVQAASAIQPGFRDLDTLKTQAEISLYKDALDGALATRHNADPPGIYYRQVDRWVYLEGSDPTSRTHGSYTGRYIIYDIGKEGTRPSPLPSPTPGGGYEAQRKTEQERLHGRRLRVASFDGSAPTFHDLAFPPSAYGYYMAGKNGIWALTERDDAPGREDSNLLRDGWSLHLYEISWQAFGSDTIVPLELPGPNWVPLTINQEGDSVILAELTNSAGLAGPVDKPRDINLYMTGPYGDDPRQILSHRGTLGNIHGDADGRYLVVSTYSPPLGGTTFSKEVYSVELFDLTQPGKKHTLLQKEVGRRLGYGLYGLETAISAFLKTGPYTGSLLLADRNDTTTLFRLIDPAQPGRNVFEAAVGGGPLGSTWVKAMADAPEILLAWEKRQQGSYLPPPDRAEPPVLVARLSPDSEPVTGTVRLIENSYLSSVAMEGNHFVYAANTYGPGYGSARTVFALPVSAIGPGELEARQVLVTEITDRSYLDWAGVWQCLGETTLAYANHQRELRVRSYDSDAEVLLETGISHLTDFDALKDVTWLR